MAAGFSFSVLGPLRAWHDGEEIDLGTPQQRAVLAAMLLRAGAFISAEELIDVLWPEDPPRTADGTMRTYVYRLRRVLGDGKLVQAGGGYVLHLRGDDLDLARFRQLADRAAQARASGDHGGAASHLDEALALWKGVPLAGITGRFAETRRVALEEMRLSAAEDWAADNLALGRHAETVAALASLAADHPYRERLRELHMLALYRAGRQVAALAVFDEVRRLFATELGIDPGPQLQDLHLRVLNADPALMEVADAESPPPVPAGSAVAPPPAQLPRHLPSFAGRRAEVESLLAAQREPAGVTVITGMAGVGKTTLAVHAAHRMADRFPDGQLYVDLRGFDASREALRLQDAVGQLLAGLGVPPERIPAGIEAQVGLYRSVLAGRRVLIVLDNARGTEQVRPLLPGGSQCGVLVTSRDQMRALIATEGAWLIQLTPFGPLDAREALTRRLGADRVNADPQGTQRLIELCAGLPLALSVVAARAAVYADYPLSLLATELSETGSRLSALADPDSGVDARASLSLSYRVLSPCAARLLRLSSLHPGPEVSREAMASLAGISTPEAVAGLEELERGHLMTKPEPGYYASHDLVRAYAAELAEADPATKQHPARMRVLDHYRQSA
ncbi:MAG TPA: BTAD domain-containing putative transcriptional regulator [Trebonia sp.]|nr:BTAD domain-containing putative transcriptional regulator [Trebonia sp.]